MPGRLRRTSYGISEHRTSRKQGRNTTQSAANFTIDRTTEQNEGKLSVSTANRRQVHKAE